MSSFMHFQAPDCSDRAFGPTSCTRTFDFTLTFEQYILSIIPSIILIIATPPRLVWLSRKHSKTLSHKRWAVKAILAAVNAALQLALLIVWGLSRNIQTSTCLPSATLSFLDAIMIFCLSYFEDRKSTRPSTLLSAYLLLSTVFDAAQVRTLWLSHRNTIAVLQTACVAIKAALLCLEAQSKTTYLSLPYRDYPPEAKSGILNLTFVWWLNRLFSTGFRRLMTNDDLLDIDPSLESEVIGKRLTIAWKKYGVQQGRFVLPKAAAASLKWDFLKAAFPRLALIGFRFAQPFLISSAINYVEGPKDADDNNHAYGLIGATFLVYLGLSVSTVHFKQCFSRIVTTFRGSMIALIYNQTLTFQDSVCAESAAFTLMSTDVDNIVEFLENTYEIWALLIEISVGTWLLEIQIEATCVVPLLVVLVCVVGQSLVANTIGKDQQDWNQAIQRRVKNTSAMLSSMKAMKISGLAEMRGAELQEERLRELTTSQPFFMNIVWLNALANLPAIWSPVITFIVFVVQAKVKGEESLNTTQAFTTLSIITLVTTPAAKLLAALPQITAALGCFNRIQEYLKTEPRLDNRLCHSSIPSSLSSDPRGTHDLDGVELYTLQSRAISSSVAVDVRDATVIPAPGAELSIANASFTIPRGSLITLTGPVGSGKTTMIKAMLGELSCKSGVISIISGSTAYCSQVPWILNGTIQENVRGPSDVDFDRKWYDTVSHACALEEDINQWPDGDSTVVGSNGLKLSGGQRQRVALARAVYSKSDILFLDDTMSALDNRTQETIIKRLFSREGLLKSLHITVVMATHSARCLQIADGIIVLDEEGKTTAYASYDSLRGMEQSSKQPVADFLETADRPQSLEQNTTQSAEKTKFDEKLLDLARRTGDLAIYRYYANTVGISLSVILIVFSTAQAFADNFPQVWLKWWANVHGEQLHKYLPVYVVLALAATALASFCIWVVFLRIMPKSAARLHQILLTAVVSAPLTFSSSTDTGITLNRFSQDMSLVDLALPIALLTFVTTSFDCLAKIALISTGSSYVAITIPFTMAAVFAIQNIYLKTSRQLRFLDLESKSPLYSHFTETLSGLGTIRAYGWQDAFSQRQAANLNHSQKPYYLLLCVQIWLNLVLGLMVTALGVIVVALAVTLRSTTNAGLLGIAMNNILGFNQSLTSVVTSWTSLETSLGAIARVKTFAETTQPEGNPEKDREAPEGWPKNGNIRFHGACATYGGDSVVLRDINMAITSGEKIGICGRSGSGKSSLILSLLRLVELSGGTITIDDVDISTLRPETVRQRLVAIPQDPFILPGSVRSNIDPHGAVSESAIVNVLVKVGIWQAVERRGGLDAILADQSFSQGEQQLICLARAMLREGKILILDEATSSVDDETDQMMQKVIKENFKDYTIISVAHRLDTIMDSDKIAVLDAGKLVDFDTPENLLGRNTLFRQIYYT